MESIMDNANFDIQHYYRLLVCTQGSDEDKELSAEIWNDWVKINRNLNSKFTIKLANAPLVEKRMVKLDLSLSNLKGTDLRESCFENCSLDSCDMTGILGNGLSFTACNIRGAIFIDAGLQGSRFLYTNLSDTCFVDARMRQCYFEICQFTGTDFSRAVLGESVFVKFVASGQISFENASLDGVIMQYADLSQVNMKNVIGFGMMLDSSRGWKADFTGSNLSHAGLQYCDFQSSSFNDTILFNADLTGSSLKKANLEGTNLGCAVLSGTDFSYSTLNGKTYITGCTYNDNTLFTGTGLASCKIQPFLRIAFEKNIRRSEWLNWFALRYPKEYREFKPPKWFPEKLGVFDKLLLWIISNTRERYPDFELNRIYYIPFMGKVLLTFKILWIALSNSMVKTFWWITDYGTSTFRILSVALLLLTIFTVMYFSGYIPLSNMSSDPWVHFWQVLHFSVATMVTLGFGNININQEYPSRMLIMIGYSVVTANLLSGYILLAALVTRLGVLFQSPGPGNNKLYRKSEEYEGDLPNWDINGR